MHTSHGILGFILLILDLWAIISTISSNETVGKKVMWTLLILILPLIGFIFWAVMGPKSSK
jgi:hypothetical protein